MMLGLPQKTLIAIEAVLDIAYHAGGIPVQSGDITGRQAIPRRRLEPLLQQMTRAGILAGVRGPRGGYRLARERRRITVGEIIRLVSSHEAQNGDSLEAVGSELGSKVVQPLWNAVTRETMTRFDALTLEDLCRAARDAGVASANDRIADYTI